MKQAENCQYSNSNLETGQLYFAPIRHHSPSCAYALAFAIKDLAPGLILIECPVNTENLIPFLQSDDVPPPMALYTVSDKQP